MQTVRQSPFILGNEMQREIDRFINAGFSRRSCEKTAPNKSKVEAPARWRPAVDVMEKTEAYVIALDVPGVAPEGIEVSAYKNTLSIKGERKDKAKDVPMHQRETVSGSFLRKFTLPQNVDLKTISARCEHGVLQITVPKVDEKLEREKQTHRIDIN